MSFAEQERALFDLLFDCSLRENFCSDPGKALAAYDLDKQERTDFSTIRPDALQIDAKMRTYLLLAHWCKSYPLTFSLVSSLDGGIEILRQLVDTETMRLPPGERAATYGSRLREWLGEYRFDSPKEQAGKEQAMILAILGAEFGMVWAATTLKQAALNDELDQSGAAEKQYEQTDGWSGRPIRFASYVCAVMFPQSYQQLKQALCPVVDSGLWKRISDSPLSPRFVSDVLKQEDPRLLVTRAWISHPSRCEPTVEHKMVELSEGFAPLFQHVDGSMSVDAMLQQLQQVGAEDALLQGVKAGFQELLEQGMLELG